MTLVQRKIAQPQVIISFVMLLPVVCQAWAWGYEPAKCRLTPTVKQWVFRLFKNQGCIVQKFSNFDNFCSQRL